MNHKNPLVFAIHATSRGFGYVVFEGPFAPYDWGTVTVRGDKNAMSLHRIEKMFDRFTPETLVLEAYAGGKARRGYRLSKLYKALVSMAANRSIQVEVYTRGDIQACFANAGAATRQEIAEAVARTVTAFEHRKPKPRKAWQSEDRRMAMFCAAALVLTHYQRDASRLFEDLMR